MYAAAATTLPFRLPNMPHRRRPPSLLILAFVVSSVVASAGAGCYTSIFSFGDSYVDTGNALRCGIMRKEVGRLPYGMTYFGRPTGRFSDGRLVADFIAQALDLPLLRPYLAGGSVEDFKTGANFAVGGATALDAGFYRAIGEERPGIWYSLEVQMKWFRQLLDLLMSSSRSSSKEVLSSSLVLMGTIGGNDVKLLVNKTGDFNEIRRYVPLIVGRISSIMIDLIELGATAFVVPGNVPMGCLPVILAMMPSARTEDYDPETGCLKSANEFAEYENNVRQMELDRIRKLHPHVLISYADYFNASMSIIRNPELFGFKPPTTSACCGVAGPYNFNRSAMCGSEMTSLWSDPSSSFSWDGVHLTDSAYRFISRGLLTGAYANPSFTEACSSIYTSVAEFRTDRASAK